MILIQKRLHAVLLLLTAQKMFLKSIPQQITLDGRYLGVRHDIHEIIQVDELIFRQASYQIILNAVSVGTRSRLPADYANLLQILEI
ncbi:hypothetical protein D3C87_1813260 [compost metagenome]